MDNKTTKGGSSLANQVEVLLDVIPGDVEACTQISVVHEPISKLFALLYNSKNPEHIGTKLEELRSLFVKLAMDKIKEKINSDR